ncbi:HD domain-containing protein [Nocardia jiangxiensis]|uniref:HD domain-containing protein n=1 Tax=Nocardia jiangxiensis TaxID=282685 RepID=A0ABW6SCK1_9NOCA|nr:HD domain-containing protein [Nocardia jiangxiensis]
MTEFELIEPVELPSHQVPVEELPSSLRESGMINWVREPLDEALDRRIRVMMPSAISVMGTGWYEQRDDLLPLTHRPDTTMMMGDNPDLPTMPERPTLADFFRLRIFRKDVQHMLQSARLARLNGMGEKVIMAALVHDIAVGGLIRVDHGYWGAQLVRPYVDEEVAWAIEKHEALRYFPDESVGYTYPENYIRLFGADYRVPEYLRHEHEQARKHRWYMTSRLLTLNDYYSFDPNVQVEFEEFEDIVGRNFRQPEQGLGFDGSPVAHMWRTMIWPNNFL